MSDNQTATIAGGIVGGIIGGYFGNPQLGFALGSAIGGALVPPEAQTIKAPRLEDTKAQSDELGTPLGIVYGTQRVVGYVSWVEGNELREEIVKSGGGGKGGAPEPETETPRYFATFAVLLAEAPEGSTYRVRRVWADTVKIVDARPQEERSDAQFAEELLSGAPIAQGGTATEVASIEGDAGVVGSVVFYDGSAGQKPPARMVSDRGKSPAHRGMAWMYFEDLPLEEWGRRIPRITAEIVQDGQGDDISKVFGKTMELPPGNIEGIGIDVVALDQSALVVNIDSEGLTGNTHPNNTRTYIDYTISPAGDVVDLERNQLMIAGTSAVVDLETDTQLEYIVGTVSWFDQVRNFQIILQLHYKPSIVAILERQLRSINGKVFVRDTVEPSDFEGVMDLGLSVVPDNQNMILFLNKTDGSFEYRRYDAILGFREGAVESGDLLFDGPMDKIHANRESAINETAVAFVESGLSRMWVAARIDVGQILVLMEKNADGDYVEVLRKTLDPQNNEVIQSGVADRGVLRSIRGDDYSLYAFGLIGASTVKLADIIKEMTGRVGLQASEIDVSELTQDVRGYVVRDTTPRSAITQLRQVFPLDIIQSGYKLKFVPRGGASVATLTDEDIQAHEPGQEIPPTVRVTHRAEVDMPRRAEIQYSDVGRRLEDGIQRQQRQSTRAEGDIRASLPVAFSADEAVKAADVLLKDSWQAQTGLSATATVQQIALEPGDIITLNTQVFSGDARITQIDDGAPGLRELDLIPDGPGVYSSAAEGDTGEAGNDGSTLGGPTQAILMDIPALDGRGLGGGHYFALSAPLAGWPGGSLVRHGDDGVSVVASLTTAAIVGYTNTTLGDGPTTIWDHGNTVNVTINRGQLSSKTELEVLNGANVVAINTAGTTEDGQGEWEIVQFADATLESDGSYTLSQLLRGRRGTERLTDQHSGAGSRVVVLDDLTGIDLLPRSGDSLDAGRQFSGVTFGDLPPAQPRRAFTWRGRNLEPYSPVHVRGFRDGSGDVDISWIRRTRSPGDYLGRSTAPLEEETESYEVDILDGSTVVRTLETTSEAVTYTASQQNTDFGSTQDAVTIRVYQISATVGRGWPAEETV